MTGSRIAKCIVSLPISNSLLVACKDLCILTLDNFDLEYTLDGHAADVKSIKMPKMVDRKEEYLLTTARSKREINLWKIDATDNPRAIFSTECETNFVSCSIVGNRLIVAAVGGSAETSCVYLFIVDDIG